MQAHASICINSHSLSLTHSIYERGVAYCSTDYLAHSLWDKYIHYEEEQGSEAVTAVTALYCRVLQYPLCELPRYMQR